MCYILFYKKYILFLVFWRWYEILFYVISVDILDDILKNVYVWFVICFFIINFLISKVNIDIFILIISWFFELGFY